MEKTCKTCIHRKDYECTCEELKESIFPKIVLDGIDNAIIVFLEVDLDSDFVKHWR